MRRLFKAILALGMLGMLVACAPAIPQKQFWITENTGGRVDVFKRQAVAYKEEGRTIVVDGMCASACAWYFIAPVCVTENARIGFHSPFMAIQTPFGLILDDSDEAKAASKKSLDEFVDAMPVAYKEFLKRSKIPSVYENGGDAKEMLWLEGEEAIKIFGRCKWLK